MSIEKFFLLRVFPPTSGTVLFIYLKTHVLSLYSEKLALVGSGEWNSSYAENSLAILIVHLRVRTFTIIIQYLRKFLSEQVL